MRKIVQISQYLALCDDSTVWELHFESEDSVEVWWKRLPPIPQDEEAVETIEFTFKHIPTAEDIVKPLSPDSPHGGYTVK